MMAQIIGARYIDGNNDGVVLFFDDGKEDVIPTMVGRYIHTDAFETWCTQGGVVSPYKTDVELLEDDKATKIDSLSKSCEFDIIAGFTSDALGATHTYQSDRDDQLNLIGMVSAGTDDYFKCHDGTAWSYQLHTIAQLKQVLADGKLIKLQKLQAFADKKAQVEAVAITDTVTYADAVASLEAIVW